MKIWSLVEGPFSVRDMPEEDTEDIPFPSQVMAIFKVSEGDIVEDMEMYFEDFSSCYELMVALEQQFEPLELELD